MRQLRKESLPVMPLAGQLLLTWRNTLVRSTISSPEISVLSVGKYFSFTYLFIFFQRRQNILTASGHRDSSGFSLMIILNLYNSCFCQLGDNATTASEGDHPVDWLCLQVAGASRRPRTTVKTVGTDPKWYSETSTDNHCSTPNEGGRCTAESPPTPCGLRSRADEVRPRLR